MHYDGLSEGLWSSAAGGEAAGLLCSLDAVSVSLGCRRRSHGVLTWHTRAFAPAPLGPLCHGRDGSSLPGFTFSVSRLVPLIKWPLLHKCVLVMVAGEGLKTDRKDDWDRSTPASPRPWWGFLFGFERFSPPSVWYIFKQNFIFKMEVL